MARDYEVDGIPSDPIQDCEICTKEERSAPGRDSLCRKRSTKSRFAQMSQNMKIVNVFRGTRSAVRSTKGSR